MYKICYQNRVASRRGIISMTWPRHKSSKEKPLNVLCMQLSGNKKYSCIFFSSLLPPNLLTDRYVMTCLLVR